MLCVKELKRIVVVALWTRLRVDDQGTNKVIGNNSNSNISNNNINQKQVLYPMRPL
jgi:hypothetical protein